MFRRRHHIFDHAARIFGHARRSAACDLYLYQFTYETFPRFGFERMSWLNPDLFDREGRIFGHAIRSAACDLDLC